MECQTVGQFKGATVRCVKWSVKLCEMECQSVGQFKEATVRCVKWNVKLWDSLKEQL